MAATGASPTSHTVIPYSTSAEVDDIYRGDCALVPCEFMHGAPRALVLASCGSYPNSEKANYENHSEMNVCHCAQEGRPGVVFLSIHWH
jgi:hypothetical protein